jgi:hypothetical protein
MTKEVGNMNQTAGRRREDREGSQRRKRTKKKRSRKEVMEGAPSAWRTYLSRRHCLSPATNFACLV